MFSFPVFFWGVKTTHVFFQKGDNNFERPKVSLPKHLFLRHQSSFKTWRAKAIQNWLLAWWRFRNPENSTHHVEVGRKHPDYLEKFVYIPGGCEWDFWTINSMLGLLPQTSHSSHLKVYKADMRVPWKSWNTHKVVPSIAWWLRNKRGILYQKQQQMLVIFFNLPSIESWGWQTCSWCIPPFLGPPLLIRRTPCPLYREYLNMWLKNMIISWSLPCRTKNTKSDSHIDTSWNTCITYNILYKYISVRVLQQAFWENVSEIIPSLVAR